MPTPPLSDHIADQLKDPTSALAAAFVIASHPGILQWAARMAGGDAPRDPQPPKPNLEHAPALARQPPRLVGVDAKSTKVDVEQRLGPLPVMQAWASFLPGEADANVVPIKRGAA